MYGWRSPFLRLSAFLTFPILHTFNFLLSSGVTVFPIPSPHSLLHLLASLFGPYLPNPDRHHHPFAGHTLLSFLRLGIIGIGRVFGQTHIRTYRDPALSRCVVNFCSFNSDFFALGAAYYPYNKFYHLLLSLLLIWELLEEIIFNK
ncbi:hypothetical protein CROQUDRAFT_329286 [Cronartium quercuum f. sp. fusiforme G11]|uniref:Uncharacterized protein n=1 Tax=Cronartium quercuum f. sp. fusiforme G11 TaxID=708437 RepID=A0A9P6NTQ6_9BASI|nr:hypothetical protein CROQUDRAFT_329286 [Cronartium quercuum f. sp. fusiforme G11]